MNKQDLGGQGRLLPCKHVVQQSLYFPAPIGRPVRAERPLARLAPSNDTSFDIRRPYSLSARLQVLHTGVQHRKAPITGSFASIATACVPAAANSVSGSTSSTPEGIISEGCSTSHTHLQGDVPAFLQRKGAFNSRGQLILKNLTYVELEHWCLQEGTAGPLNLASSTLPTFALWTLFACRLFANSTLPC